MKKYIIIVIIVGVTLGFFTGIYLYKINQVKVKRITDVNQDEINNILNNSNEEVLNTIRVNNKEEKVSPNCNLILKIYYSNCKHLIEKRELIENAIVNMTEKEIREKFNEWEIQKFTSTEIVLYKEVNSSCGEHFLLKEKDGYIVIYKLDENENVNFYKTTEISTDYLAKEDLDQIRNGIKIYTEKELNKLLEDFE